MRNNVDAVRDIATAVLYEGYVLWPSRSDAVKNHKRWTFGGIHPRAWQEAGHPDDRCFMRAETLVRAPEQGAARIEVTFRCLQIVRRRVAVHQHAHTTFVDEVVVSGQRYIPWDEAIEREVTLPPLALADGNQVAATIMIWPGTAAELIAAGDGRPAAQLVRNWRSLTGRAIATAHQVNSSVFRIRVDVHNETPWTGAARDDVLRSSFNSAHIVLYTKTGTFISLTDPPNALLDTVASCDNIGCWPVLVGMRGDTNTVLAPPIILSDYPAVAPTSLGDTFDGGEIDELLVSNILGLTDEERARMRVADPRTHEILDRTESLTSAQILRLHGTFRRIE